MIKNNWDKIAKKFNTHQIEGDIDPGAADNVLILWPEIIKVIKSEFNGISLKNKALDYGCGTGGFSKKLSEIGFNTNATDSSSQMLKIAVENIKGVNFISTSQIHNEQYELITALMVFQFNKNIKSLINKLSNSLNDNGILIFAVFNPAFIKKGLSLNQFFRKTNMDNIVESNFGETIIRTYSRDAIYYDNVMKGLGFKKISESYPKFTEEYLKKYSPDFPTDVPEYLVLAYKK